MKSPEEYTDGLTGVHPKYDTKSTLGSYRTSDVQFPNPEGMVKFLGFGMDEKDYDRGFCNPELDDKPQYDSANYVNRWSIPSSSDLTEGGPDMERDRKFREKDLVSKGFLTRSHIPTER